MKKKTDKLCNVQKWVTIVRSCSRNSLQSAVQGAIEGAIGAAFVDIPFELIGNPAERYIVDAVNSFQIGRVGDKPGPMWYEAVAVVRFPIYKETK